jgi:hypothetical protein
MAKQRGIEENQLIRLAHERLDQVIREMEANSDSGQAGVELNFHRGVVTSIHRTLSGYDKPAGGR